MNNSLRLTVTALLLAAVNLSAATHYVSLESTNPAPPYAAWATAATNIQDAVDAAAASDKVVVTNGVYAGGPAGEPAAGIRRVQRGQNSARLQLPSGRTGAITTTNQANRLHEPLTRLCFSQRPACGTAR